MKIFRKTGVAVLLTVLMIAAAIGIGRWRGARAEAVPPPSSELDTSLSAGTYLNWISDGADVLSDAQENQIALYNANWVERYDSLIAVATVSSLSEDIGDYAYNLGVEIELASADGILVVNAENGDCYLAVGPDYPMTDSQVSSYLDRYLYEDAMAGNFGAGVLNLFDGINEFYLDNYGLGYLDNSGNQVYGGRSAGEMLGAVVVLLVILVVIASVLDSMRYTSYRQRYYGVPNPPYVFRPILFWHGPGWGWYRRRWRRPPSASPQRASGPGRAARRRRLQRLPGARRLRRLGRKPGRRIFRRSPRRGLLPGRRVWRRLRRFPRGRLRRRRPRRRVLPGRRLRGRLPGRRIWPQITPRKAASLSQYAQETDRTWSQVRSAFLFGKYKTDILKYKIRFGVEIPDIPGDETSYR